MKFNNISEKKFGKLTAHWPVGKTRNGKVLWLVTCECGAMKLVTTSDLVTNHAKSCGCSKVDRFYKHGLSRTIEADIYYGARARCNNPKVTGYEYYGGRGIKFLFASLEEFIAEVGLRPDGMTIDRINTNGNYEPGNVRWITQQDQLKNRRPSKKRSPWSVEERESHRLSRIRRNQSTEGQA